MTQLTKEQWLKDIPELIYKLKKNYGFYYSGFPIKITKDILDIIKNSKNKHKIVLYRSGQRFFLVLYTKNSPSIYFTNEYRNDDNWNRIRYFEKKFSRAYKRAEKELENEQFNLPPNQGVPRTQTSGGLPRN